MSRLLLLIILLSFSSKLFAQEVYFSISGQNAKVESGEKKGVYDIWIKPKSGQPTQFPKIEVYDAGIGGFADVLFKEANTITSYSIYPFSSVFGLGDSEIIPLETTAAPISKTEIKDEQKFKNRWVEVFQIAQASANGWLIRVETNDGDDVNNFKLRLTSAAELYDIVSLDLSIGLYKLTPSTTIQLKPLFTTVAPPSLIVTGEEDVSVLKQDAFGKTIPLADSTWQYERFGLSNSWALVLTGSQQRLNNLFVAGKGSLIPWIIQPIIKEKETLTQAKISVKPLSDCNELELEAQLPGYEYNTANSIWMIENQRYVGSKTRHAFTQKGEVPISIITPTQGRYTPLYVITDSKVFVNQAPVLVLKPTKKVISPSEQVVLSASSSYDPEGKKLEFAWFVDGVFRGTESSITFASSTSGNYTIRLLLDDKAQNSACTTKDTTFTIRVNTQPYAEIELNEVVAQGTTTTMFVGSALDSDNDKLSYVWKVNGLKSDATRDTVSVEHKTNGLFEAELEVKDQSGTTNDAYSTTRKYKVNGAPKPFFTIPEIVAPEQSITLDATASNDPDADKLTYSWLLSDSRESKNAKWNISFGSPGDYQITLRVDDGMKVSNSEQKMSKPIRVNEAPIPIISSKDVSNDAEIVFSAKQSSDADQSIVNYSWDFGDGKTGSGMEISHQYAKSGTYKVKLTVDDGQRLSNSVKSEEKTVIINKNPIASFTLPEVVAPGDALVLDGNASVDSDGSISSYEWLRNGAKIGSGAVFNYRIQESGDHFITLKVKDNSGFADAVHSITKTIHVNHPPKPLWTSNPKVTAPGKVTEFSAELSSDVDDSKLSYSWKFDGASEKKGSKINQTFEKPGLVVVALTADDGRGLKNSVQSFNQIIRVNAAPIIVTEERIVSNVQSVFLDASKSYDADGSGLAFTWLLPDGSKRTEPSFTWQAPTAGYFKIGLQVDDQDGLSNSVTSTGVDVIINRPVTAVVDSLIEACTGQIIIFSSARSFDPDGDQFSTEWNFGDGQTSRDNNPYHTYEKPGLYVVTLKLSDGISVEPTVAQIPVKIAGSPTAKMTFSDTTICVNTPITFDASPSIDPNGPIGAYSWDFGDQATGFGKNVTHLFTSPGTYKVVLTVIGTEAGTCSNVSQTSVTITVVEGPEAIFDVPEWVNKGDKVALNGTLSRLTGRLKKAEWIVLQEGKDEIRLNGLTQSFTATESGKVSVRLIVEVESGSNCNISTQEKSLKVNQSPVITWNLKDSYAAKTAFTVNALGTVDNDGLITNYQWFVDGKLQSSGVDLYVSGLSNGAHEVELRVQDNSKVSSGMVSKKKTILVNAAPVAAFELASPIYAGETIKLSPKTSIDVDKDSLKSTWIVNNTQLDSILSFKATQEFYTIKLIQDDKKGLSNSKDSVVKKIKVLQSPELKVSFHEQVVLGTKLNLDRYNQDPTIYIEQNGVKSKSWEASKIGVHTLGIVWAPKDSILAKETTFIDVLEPLKADSLMKPVSIKWNPANPFVQLKAPVMNRAKNVVLRYEWILRGKVVAIGEEVVLEINKGSQEIELQVSEQNVLGSKTYVTKFEVKAN